MKKKLLIIFLAVTAIVTSFLGLTACNNGGNEDNYVETQVKITFKCDFEGKDFIKRFSLEIDGYRRECEPDAWHEDDWDGTDILEVETFQTRTKPDAKFKVYLKSGFNPDTLGITETAGQDYTVSTEESYGGMIVVITIPFSQDINYGFTFTAPEPFIDKVGFRIDDASVLEGLTEPLLLNILSNTQVWVENAVTEDENETAGFVDITKDDPDNEGDKIYTLSQHYINADLSEPYFPVYVKFDKNDPARLIYNSSYRDLFCFTSDSHSPTYTEYTQIPGTNEYAYAMYFKTSDIAGLAENEVPVLRLNWDYFSTHIAYREDNIYTSFSVTSYKSSYNSVRYDYKFALVSYQIDSQAEVTNIPSMFITKEYGKSYTLKYQFKEVDVQFNHNYEIHADKDTRIQTILNNTDFANIKLTINGERVNGYFDAATKTYTVTIGATKIPYDYNESTDNYFSLGVDKSSIRIVASNPNAVVMTTSKVFAKYDDDGSYDDYFIFSQYETETETTSIWYVEDKTQFTLTHSINLREFPKFKLKVTFNGSVVLNNKEFVPGVDYNVPTTDRTGYRNLDGVNLVKSEYKYNFLVGTQDDMDHDTASYLFYDFNTCETLYIHGRDISNTTSQTQLKIEIEALEYSKDIAFEVEGELYDGIFTVNGEQKNVLTTNAANELAIRLSLSDYDYSTELVFELYSNGVLIASYDTRSMSGTCHIDGYRYDRDVMSFLFYPYGSYEMGFANGWLTFKSDIRGDFFVLCSEGFEDGMESVALVVIDKIVLKVNN